MGEGEKYTEGEKRVMRLKKGREKYKSKAWVKAQDEREREGGRIGNEVHCKAAEGPD